MHCRHPVASIILGLLLSSGACATDIRVVGLFPNKAVVQIDGGALQTLAVGQKTADGIVLLAVDADGATFAVHGERVTLGLGHGHTSSDSSAAAKVLITADERGQFLTNGLVNGITIRFAVDTGATMIALPARDATRLGLDYRKGSKVAMYTANGSVPAYHVTLDTVRLGDVTVHGVDAAVLDGDGLPIALLGMSFLRRMDIKREGEIMTLTQRY